MEWIIIVVVLLAAFGPMLWLVPSRQDRRLARMRARARQHGLVVEVTSIADPEPAPEARVSAGGKRREPRISGTTYQLNLPRAAPLAPAWSLIRAPGEGPAGVGGWRWEAARGPADAAWSEVEKVLAHLPEDALRCAVDGRQVSCFWRERAKDEDAESAVDRLAECLSALAEIQRLRHAARQAERDRERMAGAPGDGPADGPQS